MQARFDFAGTLIPPTEDLPTHLGLHHHGEEPEVSGQEVKNTKILLLLIKLNISICVFRIFFFVCSRTNKANLILLLYLSPAGRLLAAGTLPVVSESGHPAEESGPQHSGQHSLKGT